MADLGAERSVRLLNAKVAELEHYSLESGEDQLGTFGGLAADIALIASLLAEHIQRAELD